MAGPGRQAIASSSKGGMGGSGGAGAGAAKKEKDILDEELAQNGLSRYSLNPPSWRAPWLAGIDNSGTPLLYPTCDQQDEDLLTEAAVKNGFSGNTIVKTESFSAHQIIYDKLKGDTIMPALARLASEVADRIAKRTPTFAPAAFRLPQRLTLNEQKREAWYNDLANPTVPLAKLARSVPHGNRGEKIMEMLCSRQVPLVRAVWYVRALGAIEIATGMKSRGTFSIAQYTREWTGHVQEFLRKQLAEIALPGGTSPALAANEKGKGVLVEPDLRAAWIARFGYTLRLLEGLFEEQLVERDSFLRFLIAQTELSNVGQLPFVLYLVEEYLGEFMLSEPLSARLAFACFNRLSELERCRETLPQLDETTHSLTSLIRSLFIALPDAFVACPLWRTYSAQLKTLMLATPGLDPSLLDTIRADIADIKARDLAPGEGTQDAESLEPDELDIIQILDDIAFPVDLTRVHQLLFHKRKRRQPLARDLDILFSWATTSYRSGSHRSYAVAALIAIELNTPSSSDDPLDVETGFIKWIDSGVGNDRWAITHLLAELIRVGAVSYALYLQRMIARGETEQVHAPVGKPASPPSMHLHLLRTVALYGEVGHSLAKRRVALLAGSSARNETKRLIDEAEQALEAVLPGLVSGVPTTRAPGSDCTILLAALDALAKDGSHFVITRHLIPQGISRILRASNEIDRTISSDDHAVLAEVFSVVRDYWGLLQYLILILRHNPSRELLIYVLDSVEGHLLAWTSMAALPALGKALLGAHEALKRSGINDRRLVALLRRLGAAGHFEVSAVAQLEQDFANHALSLATSRPQAQGLPAGLPELQTLVTESSPRFIAELATTLWYRYHAFDNWGHVVLDAAIRLISQAPVPTISLFLREINERLPTGIEPCIAKWMGALSPAMITMSFGGPAGPALAALLAELVLEGTLAAASVVTAVIIPAWKVLLSSATAPPLSHATLPEDKALQLRGLETVAFVFGSIVGYDPAGDSSNAKHSIRARQRAKSRRASLYTQPNLPDIGRCIAMLAIQQELWTARSDYEKAHIASMLILHVSNGASFKMAVSRDPQALATAMLDSPSITSIPAASGLRPQLLVALLLILKDGNTATPASLVSTEDWDLFLSGLTIWRLAVSKVEVQTCLERLDLDTSLSELDKNKALNTLACHFLDRVCYGEGHMYLGEQVVRCYHGRASDELVSVAFARLAEAVDGLAFTASPELRSSSVTTVRCSGRLLDILLQSGKASSRLQPLTLLLSAIKASLEGILDSTTPPPRDVVLHLALLTRIAIRCAPSIAPPAPISGASSTTLPPPLPEWVELIKETLVPLARLAMDLAKAGSPELELGGVLLDTSAHVLFALTKMLPSFRLPSMQSLFSADLDFDSLPDPVLARLTRLFGQYNGTIPVPNPWELVDYVDSGIINKTIRNNTGPFDLSLFDARIVEPIPAITALDVNPQSPATSSGHSERGLQTNFDFETPCIGLGIAARDFRRTLTGGKVILAKYDPVAKQKAKEAEAAAAAAAATVAAASPRPAGGGATPNVGGGGTRPGKRKELPSTSGNSGAGEILIIDSDDDDLPLATTTKTTAPSAKRPKNAGTTAPKPAKAPAKKKSKA